MLKEALFSSTILCGSAISPALAAGGPAHFVPSGGSALGGDALFKGTQNAGTGTMQQFSQASPNGAAFAAACCVTLGSGDVTIMLRGTNPKYPTSGNDFTSQTAFSIGGVSTTVTSQTISSGTITLSTNSLLSGPMTVVGSSGTTYTEIGVGATPAAGQFAIAGVRSAGLTFNAANNGDVLSITYLAGSDNYIGNVAGSMALQWSGNYYSSWAVSQMDRSWNFFAEDDAGVNPVRRLTGFAWDINMNQASPQVLYPHPLLSQPGSDNNGGQVTELLQKHNGVWTFSLVTPHAVLYQDMSATDLAFGTITNKVIYIGAPIRASMSNLYGDPYWGQSTATPVPSLAGFMICNCAVTPAQAVQFENGADPRAIGIPLQPGVDHFWPGVVNGTYPNKTYPDVITPSTSATVEVDGGSGGTLSVSQVASTYPTLAADGAIEVLQQETALGQLYPYQINPSTGRLLFTSSGASGGTGTVRWPVTHIGPTTAQLQIQFVVPGSTYPATGGNVLVPWQTIGSNVANGQTVPGVVTGVPSMTKMDTQIRWLNPDGVTYNGYASGHGTDEAGLVILDFGQSIIEKEHFNTSQAFTLSPYGSGHGLWCSDVSEDVNSNGNEDQFDFQGARSLTGAVGSATVLTSAQSAEINLDDIFTQESGMAIQQCNLSIAGQPIDTFSARSDPQQRTANAINHFGATLIRWEQGQGSEADVTLANYLPASGGSTYTVKLNQLLSEIEADIEAAPGGAYPYDFIVSPMSESSASGAPYYIRWLQWLWPNYVQTVTKSSYPNLALAKTISTRYTVANADQVHPTPGKDGYLATDFGLGRDLAWLANVQACDGRGGTITGATYSVSGTVSTVNIPVALCGGTALAFSSPSSANPPPFVISNAGTTTAPIATWGLDSTGTTIVLTTNVALAANSTMVYASYPPAFLSGATTASRLLERLDNVVTDNEAAVAGPGGLVQAVSTAGPGYIGTCTGTAGVEGVCGMPGLPIDIFPVSVVMTAGTTVPAVATTDTITVSSSSGTASGNLTVTGTHTGLKLHDVLISVDAGTPLPAIPTQGSLTGTSTSYTASIALGTATGTHTGTITEGTNNTVLATFSFTD